MNDSATKPPSKLGQNLLKFSVVFGLRNHPFLAQLVKAP
jgi:hypothetical protein